MYYYTICSSTKLYPLLPRNRFFTIDGKEEYPVYENYFAWNSTHQLTDYHLVNFNNSNANFNVRISYANPGGNQLKSIWILNPSTGTPLEEREYTNGSFDVTKIAVKRHVLNVPQPDLFEVKNLVFDQTDSILLNQHQKKIIHYTINDGIANYLRYIYKSRKVEVYGEIMDYQQLDQLVKDGKEYERYEYEYDARGNWTVCKIYRVKYARWEYARIIRGKIEYRN